MRRSSLDHSPRTIAGTALVLANPAAANVTERLVQDIADRLTPCVDRLVVAITTRRGEALDAAAAASASGGEVGLVVAVGGDGTVREVAEGIVRSTGSSDNEKRAADGPAVLVLPAGSGNSTLRNIWGEVGWDGVIERAFDPERSEIRTIDVLHALEPDSYSVLGVSTGFLPAVLVAARSEAGLVGIDRYRAGAASILYDLPADPTVVRVDGTTLHDGPTLLAAVGGGRYRAQTLKFLPDSVLDDGLLDVCVIDRVDADGLLELAAVTPTGDHRGRPDVHFGRGRRVEIERTDGGPLLTEYDGEVWAPAGPLLTIEVIPGALRVVSPIGGPQGEADDAGQFVSGPGSTESRHQRPRWERGTKP